MVIAGRSLRGWIMGCFMILASAMAQAQSYTAADVAKHTTKSDCWMIIGGKVYDLTNYLPQHPAPLELMLGLCGKDATDAWNTKGGRGRAHSARAAAILESYHIGALSR